MTGFYRRLVRVALALLPFAIAFLRDRRRFLLVGRPRRRSGDTHRERAVALRDTFLDLGPAFIKVGQVLSTRPDIVPPEYAEVLATLQDEVPEGIGGDPRQRLVDDLGDALDHGSVEPVAGGSLAYVFTAEVDGERLAFKVRRPNITEYIERDLQVIRALVPVVGIVADERHHFSLRNVADDFERIILDELDFEREARMMQAIGENVRDDEVIIPNVVDEFSDEHIIAMEYVHGTKITDHRELGRMGIDRQALAQTITEVYLEMGLIDGVFHADPHPGNLAVADDGRLIIYDFGMSERLAPGTKAEVVGLYRSLVSRDVDELIDSLIALEVLEPGVDRRQVRDVLELFLQNLEGRPTITWRHIITELYDQLHEFPFRIPPDVMLLIRVGTVGEGVCRQLDPNFDFIEAARRFLLDAGLLEHELEAVLRQLHTDLLRSAPAVAGLPARIDRTLDQLERGELTVTTQSTESTTGNRAVGYAIVSAGLVIAAALLIPSNETLAALAFIVAVLTFIGFLRQTNR